MFCPQCGTWNRAASATCSRCENTLPELDRAPFERPDDELTRLRRATGNRYRVQRRLGGGGMADVYLAQEAVSDTAELDPIVVRILEANPGEVAAYRGGKEGLLGFFVGQVMRETGGKATARAVSDLVREKLQA